MLADDLEDKIKATVQKNLAPNIEEAFYYPVLRRGLKNSPYMRTSGGDSLRYPRTQRGGFYYISFLRR